MPSVWIGVALGFLAGSIVGAAAAWGVSRTRGARRIDALTREHGKREKVLLERASATAGPGQAEIRALAGFAGRLMVQREAVRHLAHATPQRGAALGEQVVQAEREIRNWVNGHRKLLDPILEPGQDKLDTWIAVGAHVEAAREAMADEDRWVGVREGLESERAEIDDRYLKLLARIHHRLSERLG